MDTESPSPPPSRLKNVKAILVGQPVAWTALVAALVSALTAGLINWGIYVSAAQARRQSGLEVRLVAVDANVFLAAVTGRASAEAEVVVTRNGKQVPGPKSPAPKQEPPPPPEPKPADETHELFQLLVRNMAERPAGIVDVKVLRADRTEVPIDAREYRRRTGTPMALPAWDVRALTVRVDGQGWREGAWLVLVDMDDKTVELPLRPEAPDRAWRKFK